MNNQINNLGISTIIMYCLQCSKLFIYIVQLTAVVPREKEYLIFLRYVGNLRTGMPYLVANLQEK